MKRYIRTIDNKFIDTEVTQVELVNDIRIPGGILVNGVASIIVIESDNIVDLIQVVDLVEATYTDRPEIVDYIADVEWLIENHDLGKVYTKQGDNYILVWEKKRGVI